MAAPRQSWKRTTCPLGGAHCWRLSAAADAEAPLATCAFGFVTLLLFWPALVLLPLVYLGSHAVAAKTGDRVCDKCGMAITHKGSLLRPPLLVPALNPATGRPNAELGYTPTPQVVLVPRAPTQAIGVPCAVPPVMQATVAPPQQPQRAKGE